MMRALICWTCFFVLLVWCMAGVRQTAPAAEGSPGTDERPKSERPEPGDNPGANAKSRSEAASENADRPKPPKAQRLNAEQAAAALEFVKQHHPELAKLLNRLESSKPQEYQRASAICTGRANGWPSSASGNRSDTTKS